MKKFIVIYHMPDELLAQTADTTPDERAKGMEGWMIWAKKCGDALLDLGNPLMGGVKLQRDGQSQASKREVCGYSILQAADMAGAQALLAEHPHMMWNGSCSIEVHEAAPLPGM